MIPLITDVTEETKKTMFKQRQSILRAEMCKSIRNGFAAELTTSGCEAWVSLAYFNGLNELAQELSDELINLLIDDTF